MPLYGGTLAFNLIWFHAARASLLAGGLTPDFIRDVNIRYLLGLLAYAAATLLALIFAFGTSVRPAFAPDGGGHDAASRRTGHQPGTESATAKEMP